MIVVAVLVNGGDSPALGLFLAAFFLPFTMSFYIIALILVSLGTGIAQHAMLTRRGVKIDAVPERWRHTESSDDGQISHKYHVKASYVVPSSMDVQQPNQKKPTKNFEAPFEDITQADSTTDEKQEDESTIEAVDKLVLHKWFVVSPSLYLMSQTSRKIALVILPNQPYVAMTEEEADVGCVEFYCAMMFKSVFMSLFALVFGFAGIFIPASLFTDQNGSLSALWILVPYFCMTVSGAIWYCLANRSAFEDSSRDDISIQNMVTAVGEATT